MSANIKVAVRVRPFTELQATYSNTQIKVDKRKRQIRVQPTQQGQQAEKSYNFDCVLSEASTQEDVYKNCGIDYLVAKVLEGYHSTIFVYGQTGSGKTFTMQGSNVSQIGDGIVPRVVESLFQKINSSQNKVVSVSVSYLQIYSEKIFDLLNPGSFNPKVANSGSSLRLRWNKDEQFTVENLFVYECQDKQELLGHVRNGLSNRVNGSHKLNISSSRSHTILTLRVRCQDKNDPSFVLNSRIELVDLAGSQRTSLTGSQGRLAKQSIDINKSLFTLRQVISVLSQQQRTHIPYRQSKLTSLLKQSIGGNSYCLMIACLSPNDLFLDENISTLTYATKASMIINDPVQNKDPHKKEIDELQAKIKELNVELQKANRNNEIIKKIEGEEKCKVDQQQSKEKIKSKRVHFDTFLSKAAALLSKVEKNQEKTGEQHKGDSYWDMLLESVGMVRDLLKNNRDLRDQNQDCKKLVEKKDLQIHQLFRQNEQLKSGSRQYLTFQSNLPVFKKPSRVQSRFQRHKTQYSPDKQLFVPIIDILAKQRKAQVQQKVCSDTQQLDYTNKSFKTTTLLYNKKPFYESFHDKLDFIANKTRTKSSTDKYAQTALKRTFVENSPFKSHKK